MEIYTIFWNGRFMGSETDIDDAKKRAEDLADQKLEWAGLTATANSGCVYSVSKYDFPLTVNRKALP